MELSTACHAKHGASWLAALLMALTASPERAVCQGLQLLLCVPGSVQLQLNQHLEKVIPSTATVAAVQANNVSMHAKQEHPSAA